MSAWEEETRRLAALARLSLSPDESRALARGMEDITRAFGDLEAYAAALPAPPPEPAGALRDDEPSPSPPGEADAILAAAPRVDRASRRVLVGRGGA